MKQTGIIASLLTLLSLLLVVSAAVVFLFQGRQELRQENVRLQAEIADQNRTISQVQSTAAAREMVLVTSQSRAATREVLVATNQAQAATAEAMLATRENELAQSRLAIEELEEVAATREAEMATRSAELPEVSIIRPLPETVISEDDALEIFVIAGHPEGIDYLRIVVGDRPVNFQGDGEAYRVFDYRATLLSPGPLTITATITSTNQLTANDVVRVTVGGEQPSEGDTQGLQRQPPVAVRPR